MKLIKSPRERWDDITEDATPMPIPTTKLPPIIIGNFRFSLAIGDANGNGTVDVSLTIRIVGFFEFPPFVLDLDGTLAEHVEEVWDGIVKRVTRKAK